MTDGVIGLRIDVAQVEHTVPRLVIRFRRRIRYFVGLHRFVFFVVSATFLSRKPLF